MPVTRIAIREGKTSEYKRALMDEIYEAMRETVAIKDGDRFMAITEHGEDAFAYGPFLGIDRSDDLVQIQVFWAPGKAAENWSFGHGETQFYPTNDGSRARHYASSTSGDDCDDRRPLAEIRRQHPTRTHPKTCPSRRRRSPRPSLGDARPP
jgi:Tautomerase enzyme